MVSTSDLYKAFLLSTGVTTNSRQVLPGNIFFALKGDTFNGNLFAEEALETGCKFAVVDDPSKAINNKFLLVQDTLRALQDLAAFHRKHLKIPVIGLTGSNGKTTTRELLTAVLSKKFRTLSSQGNLNNHIGVPLTILNAMGHQIAVVEMGANHPGEIKTLCEIARPDYGIITNIGKAHLEGFGSFEGVVKTKKELYDYLEISNGIVFVNYSNPLLKDLSQNLNIEKIIYGDSEYSVCKGQASIEELFLSIKVNWNYNGQSGENYLNTQLAGLYNSENVLAAITVGLYFQVDINDIISAICSYSPGNNRSQITKTSSNTLVLDAYNANPTSMINALENFSSYNHPGKLAILGDMLELGEYSAKEHLDVLNYLDKHPSIDVILVGNEFCKADSRNKYRSFNNAQELGEYLRLNPLKDLLILLKGSRGIRLESILKFI